MSLLLLHGSGSTTTNSYSYPPVFLHGIILMMHTRHTAMAAAAASGTDSCPAEESDERDDPGAAPYGNFINYYTFNPPENRLSLIPTTLLQDLGYHSHQQPTLILDVGCNSGELSVALHQHLKKNASSPEEGGGGGEDEAGEKPADILPLHILGFDLDERLVRRAQENSPLPEAAVSFVQLDITADDSQSRLLAYAERHGCPRFHVCLCLAVTMWVHLNHGDGALLDMLSRLAAVSDHLLLEAQPWKCYRAAARRQRRAAGDGDGARLEHHFKTLKIRGDMAEHAREHLESRCGMELAQSFGSTAWDRRLLLFKRK